MTLLTTMRTTPTEQGLGLTYYDLIRDFRRSSNRNSIQQFKSIMEKYFPSIRENFSEDLDFVWQTSQEVNDRIDAWLYRESEFTIHRGSFVYPDGNRRYCTRNTYAYLRDRLSQVFAETDTCADCDEPHWTDDMIYTNNDNYVGTECGCDGNYRFHEGDQCYYHDDDYPYDEDYDDDEENYNDPTRTMEYNAQVHTILDKVRMPQDLLDAILSGVEIEVERRNNCPHNIVEQILGTMHKYALIKRDGSLNDGFEVVSAPATLMAHKHYWSKFCEKNYNEYLSSWHTNTCGMHVHVDRRSLTPLDIGKLLVFINCEHNAKFVKHIAGRSSSSWARRDFKSAKDGTQRSDKYEAINLGKEETIEFRIFRGNIGKIGIFRALEFVYALVYFVKQSALDKNTDYVRNLKYENFIEFVRQPSNKSQYPYFYTWLVKQGYITTNKKKDSEVLECA